MKRKLSSILNVKDYKSRKAQSLPVPSQSSSSSTTLFASSSSLIVPLEVLKHTYCNICMEEKQTHEMFNKMGCGHNYCKNCIGLYISTSVNQGMVHLKCPEPACKDGVLVPEICGKIVPENIYSKWLDALCEAAFPSPLKLYCPFKDCSALLVWDADDDNDNEEERPVYNVCPHCKREFCVKCRVAWHSKFTCEEYEGFREESEDAAFQRMADDLGWKRCPDCLFYVQKASGCSYIQCRCRCKFCYSCGNKMVGRGHNCPNCAENNTAQTQYLLQMLRGGGPATSANLDRAWKELFAYHHPIPPPAAATAAAAAAVMSRANGPAIAAVSPYSFWGIMDHGLAENRTGVATSRDGQPPWVLPFFPGTKYTK